MAFDNLVLEKITNELSKVVQNSYIDNVFALGDNQFALSFHGSNALKEKSGGRGTLILFLDPNRPFITYSTDKYTKIALNTPFFNSMKKIIGTQVKNVTKEKGERVITLTTVIPDIDFGELVTGYKLILELFPSKPNIIFVSTPGDKIVSVYKDFTDITAKRVLMRNTQYVYPPERNVFSKAISSLADAKSLLSFDLYKRLEKLCQTVPFEKARDLLLSDPNLYFINNTILPYSFSDPNAKKVHLDEIYPLYVANQKELARSLKEKELTNKLTNALKTAQRKLKNLNEDYQEAQKKLKFKDIGNLLFLYQTEYKPKMTSMTLEGVTIALDPQKNVIENANLYFKKYHKAKQAIVILQKLKLETLDEIEYLKKKILEVNDGGNKDIMELKEELIMEGYLKDPSRHPKKLKVRSYQPHILKLPDGTRIGYGANGLQNEQLTFKMANKNDLFFHVKDYPGAHVVLLDQVRNENAVHLAAEFALFLSKLDSGDVMMTERKNVKKNPSKIGLVNVLKYQTITIKKIRNEDLDFFKKEFVRNKA